MTKQKPKKEKGYTLDKDWPPKPIPKEKLKQKPKK